MEHTKKFLCSHSHIYTAMLDNVSLEFLFTFPLVFPFHCGTLLQYFVYLKLIVIIFSTLINHNRIKTTASIPHIILASARNTGDGGIFISHEKAPSVQKLLNYTMLFQRRNKFNSLKKIIKSLPKRASSEAKFLF